VSAKISAYFLKLCLTKQLKQALSTVLLLSVAA